MAATIEGINDNKPVRSNDTAHAGRNGKANEATRPTATAVAKTTPTDAGQDKAPANVTKAVASDAIHDGLAAYVSGDDKTADHTHQADKAPAADPPAKKPAQTLTSGGDANNMQNGYTFAGFSPQNHQGADLNDWKNYKYTAYQYLVDNKTDPNDKTWANKAAKELNEQYHTDVFKAEDGETLAYGDEFIHTAPNGHGMPRGTFNPDAKGEFFWGSRGPDEAPAQGGGPAGGAANGTANGSTLQSALPLLQQWKDAGAVSPLLDQLLAGGAGAESLWNSFMGSSPAGSSGGSKYTGPPTPPGVQEYLLQLIRSGVPPQEAAKMANEKFGLKTGGEAVYYPETNTVGLPEFYLAGPTNKPDSPKEWGVVNRG